MAADPLKLDYNASIDLLGTLHNAPEGTRDRVLGGVGELYDTLDDEQKQTMNKSLQGYATKFGETQSSMPSWLTGSNIGLGIDAINSLAGAFGTYDKYKTNKKKSQLMDTQIATNNYLLSQAKDKQAAIKEGFSNSALGSQSLAGVTPNTNLLTQKPLTTYPGTSLALNR